jgi:hypothetical protein
MLDEMDTEQLRLVGLNNSLSEETRDHLKRILRKGKIT